MPKSAARIDKVLVLVSLVILGAQQQDFPSEASWSTWTLNAPWLIPALLVAAGVFSLGPFGARAESRLNSSRTALQRQIFIGLGRILTEVERVVPNFDHDDLGMHAWGIERPFWKPWSPHLRRIGTYRLG